MSHEYKKVEISKDDFKAFIENGVFNKELEKRGINPNLEFRIVEEENIYIFVQRDA